MTTTDDEPLHVDSVMKKWKVPPTLDFVSGAVKRWSFPNWQSGNDDSVYYNLNIPSFFKTKICMPPAETSVLEREINADLLNLTFHDESAGASTVPLKEYLVGPKQVQAMMMMHKGKVVFEIYPGMNTNSMHVWMSASKTSVGLLCCLLWEEGKLDFDKSVSEYVPELAVSPRHSCYYVDYSYVLTSMLKSHTLMCFLSCCFKGTAWSNVTMKNVMNMCSALEIEETFESLTTPGSWIGKFFTSVMEPGKGEWREIMKEVVPIKGEKPNEIFRYSTANTQVLVLAIENITQMPYEEFFNQRIWSKIGAKYPFMVGLAPDNTPVGGGLNVTTPQDFLRYAMIFTPYWNVVSKEQIVSNKVLKYIQDMGNPACYTKSEERGYGFRWFGEYPQKNTAQWDHAFPDGAMFKHGNMGQGIYVDPKRDFCGIYFGLASNDEAVTGADKSPGFMRAAAKLLHGE